MSKLTLNARLVRGTNLRALDSLLGLSSDGKPSDDADRCIYLVARLDSRGVLGRRVLSVRLEFLEPDVLEGTTVEMCAGFDGPGSTYLVQKVIVADTILPGELQVGEKPPADLRERVVKSAPRFKVVEMFVY